MSPTDHYYVLENLQRKIAYSLFQVSCSSFEKQIWDQVLIAYRRICFIINLYFDLASLTPAAVIAFLKNLASLYRYHQSLPRNNA